MRHSDESLKSDPHPTAPVAGTVHPLPHSPGETWTVRHVTQLVLKLPAGPMLVIIGGIISLAGAIFGAGYRTATYYHDPGVVEQQLITQKDAIQAQADKFRDLAAERLRQVESLSGGQKSVTDRFDQFVQDTSKTISSLKEESAATMQQMGTSLHDRELAVQQRDQTIAGLNLALTTRGQDMQRLIDTLKDKDAALQQRDQAIAALNQALATRAQESQRAAELVKDREGTVQQRDQTIAGLNQSLTARAQEVQRLSDALKERDQAIAGLNQTVTARNLEVQRLTASVKERDDTIRQRDQTIGSLKAEPGETAK